MNVLVACEESQRVCTAFREKGHNAFSCGGGVMKMTKSFEVFISRYHKDLLVPLSFGHIELLTDEIWWEYLSWGKADEARPYLMGGEFYEEAK